ncbi:MAG: putative transporter, permease protein [Acidobacteria bacterium]|nr:putative transporter, permease protein [Acidobacteriota bacterium]
MTQAFLIVTLQMLKNRIVSNIRRLKNPRYLLSTLAGLAYFWFMFLRRTGRHGRGPGIFIGTIPMTELVVDIGSLVILVLMIGAWALPEQSGGLEFSEAEIQFLFAAPISRTQILLYKFMRGLTGIVISATMMTVFGFRQAKGIGLLFMFGTLSAYFIMVALGRARLKQMGIGWLARLTIALAILVGISWVATMQLKGADIGGAMNGLARGRPSAVAAALDAKFHGPIVNTFLFVPRVFATAMFPPDLLHLFIACAGLVVFGFVVFQIAARLNVSFEEASIRYSKRKADKRERQQQRQRGVTVNYRRGKPLFRLGDVGRPEVAFIWKNSLSVIRTTGWGVVALFAPIICCSIVLSQLKMIPTGNRFLICGSLCLILAGILALMGPMMLKNDLRLDLPRFEVLKTYPLSGETIVAGEIAAPLALLSAMQVILIAAGSIFFSFATVPSKFQLFSTAQFAIIAIIFVIPICAVQLLIQNAAAVYFPAWANPSKEDVKGFVVMGQRLLVLACYLVVLSIVLIPPAAIFVPTIFFAEHFLSGTPIFAALTTLAPVAVLLGEIYLAVKLLGAQFERIDVSEER